MYIIRVTLSRRGPWTSRQPAEVLVVGDSGTGKSHFVQQACARAGCSAAPAGGGNETGGTVRAMWEEFGIFFSA